MSETRKISLADSTDEEVLSIARQMLPGLEETFGYERSGAIQQAFTRTRLYERMSLEEARGHLDLPDAA